MRLTFTIQNTNDSSVKDIQVGFNIHIGSHVINERRNVIFKPCALETDRTYSSNDIIEVQLGQNLQSLSKPTWNWDGILCISNFDEDISFYALNDTPLASQPAGISIEADFSISYAPEKAMITNSNYFMDFKIKYTTSFNVLKDGNT